MHPSDAYLLSGSFAYDTILRHPRHFQESILPEGLAKLNVAFDITSVEKEFGGTGGNIAYNASLLNQSPRLIGTLGNDAAEYLDWLDSNQLNTDTLTLVGDVGCAHAWITSDAADNQITSFSMGAMRHYPNLPANTPDLWHLAPENPLTTANLAKEAVARNKVFFFDPGQVLPAFLAGAADGIFPLKEILAAAQGIFVNDYEADLLIASLGVPLEHWLVKPSQFILRTRGSKGLRLSVLGADRQVETFELGVAQTTKIVDPTGCGDALRAGFIKGYLANMTLPRCAALGAVMGSFAIECNGGQNHLPSPDDITDRFTTYCEEHEMATE
jgi:adenosine kinase